MNNQSPSKEELLIKEVIHAYLALCKSTGPANGDLSRRQTIRHATFDGFKASHVRKVITDMVNAGEVTAYVYYGRHYLTIPTVGGAI